MNTLHAIILGAVQGLSEFLPISSSGHLVAIPYIFNWNYQGVSFDVALHAGTAIAILGFFWRDWIGIIKKGLGVKSKENNLAIGKYPDNLLWQILVASIPAAIIGLAIDKFVEKNFHSMIFVAINFILFGFLLWYSDKKAKQTLSPQKLTYGKSFLIGLSQSIALIPGVSRSGITLTASRWIGLEREEAARFSFLLATPAIVGAFLLKLPDIEKDGIGLAFWLGIAASTAFGLLAIKFLLNYLKKSDFSYFLWYRVLLGILLVGLVFFR